MHTHEMKYLSNRVRGIGLYAFIYTIIYNPHYPQAIIKNRQISVYMKSHIIPYVIKV